MSSIIIGILLLLSLVGLIYYAVKGKNLMVGFLVITTLWLVLVLVGNALSPNPLMADLNHRHHWKRLSGRSGRIC